MGIRSVVMLVQVTWGDLSQQWSVTPNLHRGWSLYCNKKYSTELCSFVRSQRGFVCFLNLHLIAFAVLHYLISDLVKVLGNKEYSTRIAQL